MKYFFRDISLPESFKTFFTVMTVLSIVGGYLVSQSIYESNQTNLQRSYKLLEIESHLNDSTVALSQQIQEWKDMLLRADDKELYHKHLVAFLAAGERVQDAFRHTKTSMQNGGMDTSKIEHLINEYNALISDYSFAKTQLNPKKKDSFHDTDKLAIGVDRNLQQHLAEIKADVENYSMGQLSGAIPTLGYRIMLGLLGAMSLLIMSLAGVLYASNAQSNKTPT